MTSKQRAYLRSLSSAIDSVVQIGKAGLTTEFIDAVKEVLESRELIKINVLKNCMEEPKEIADALASHTRSEVVQVIGRKIILYKQADERDRRNIVLPK